MLPALVERGLLADDTMHGYHCSCVSCDFNGRWALRCQSDSSCNGEIISKPFTDFDEATYVMTVIQDVAVEADAVPGYNAGFHVHVGEEALDDQDPVLGRARMFWQWLRWEPAMEALASGPFGMLREFNPSCRQRVVPGLSQHRRLSAMEWFGTFYPTDFSGPIIRWANDNLGATDLKVIQKYALSTMAQSDRHSALAVDTRFRTFEFRLWNSTRSAWRMEMFARLSVHWMDLNFVEILSESPVPDTVEQQLTVIRDALLVCDFERAAELVERQVQFNAEHEDMPDPVFVAA